ncbi:hypothetical protein [Thermococcus sp.]|uniref:hypothetical protein n=1 Tax=Thermococcus sp. TaxID=35749 RepID=UPI0025D2F995|nr:hypothetical protein [Thermococcus sp.]
MLKIIKEHEDAFRLARIDTYKLGEISKKAIKKHATVEYIYAVRLGAVESGIASDALEEAYLVKPFSEFAADDNIPKIAETLVNELAKVGIHVDRKRAEEAFRRAKPVVESLVKEAYMNPTYGIISSTIDEHQYIIKGIKTNKEFREFLVEISGKKPLAKFKQVQKQVEAEPRTRGLPEDAKVEVLSILRGLEFADYSEKAKEKALGKLASMLEELSKEELTHENLQKIGLVAFAIEIIKRGEFERVEEIKKL